MIHFQDIAVCYKARERYPVNALENIDLHVAAGEWVFFVGPSGAGKSTLLKLIYHGHGAEAMSGKILVDGQDITHLRSHDIALLRRKIGVVFQDFQLLGQKTVWENVAFALQVIGTPQSRLVKDVPRALETVGLTHKASARPHELSGGEQQRIAIARAIVNDPTVLILDEPTGNLDPQTGADIAEVLKKVNERGTTILMATHDRNLVDSMKRRVVRIADGQIVSDEACGIYHPEDDEIAVIAQSTVEFDRTPPIAEKPQEPAKAPIERAPLETRKPTPREIPAQTSTAEFDRTPHPTPNAAPHENSPQQQSTGDSSRTPNFPPREIPTQTSPQEIDRTPNIAPQNSPQQSTGDSSRTPNFTPREIPAQTSTAEFDRTPNQTPNVAPQNLAREKSAVPPTRIEPPVSDYVTDTLENSAPLGSPENPIVQLDRR